MNTDAYGQRKVAITIRVDPCPSVVNYPPASTCRYFQPCLHHAPHDRYRPAVSHEGFIQPHQMAALPAPAQKANR